MSEQQGITAPWGAGQLVYNPTNHPGPHALGIVVTGLAPRAITEYLGEPFDRRYVTIVTFSGSTYTLSQSTHEENGWGPAPYELDFVADEPDQDHAHGGLDQWGSEESEEEDTTFVDALSADVDELEVRVDDVTDEVSGLRARVEQLERHHTPAAAHVVLHHVRRPGPSPYDLSNT